MRSLTNIYRLGVKELWSVARDPIMIVLLVFSFTLLVFTSARSAPDTLVNAPLAIVDEDNSPLSARIASAFYPPSFRQPAMVPLDRVDPGMDRGDFTFALVVPVNFQRDVLRNRNPDIQLNVDATRMSQAFAGSGYVQQIVMGEVMEFVQRYRGSTPPPVDLVSRVRFNPTLEQSWFSGVMTIIDRITLVSLILAGAALIREREHGTIEHLLVMPVTPFEIMMSKIWATGLLVLVAAAVALVVVVQGLLRTPIQGSRALFLVAGALNIASMTAMGILLATLTRSMAQFCLLLPLVLMPLQMLSGGSTPRESMPDILQTLMLASPTTHYVAASQAILFRGAGIDIVWPQLLAMVVIGAVFFWFAHARFRTTLARMA